MTLLEVNDLHVAFSVQGRRLEALRGVSLTIQPKEKIGIVGESGCGKSVLAKAIAGLLPPRLHTISGSIVYQGHNLLSLSEKRFRSMRGKEIGVVFQDPMTSLNPTMRIGEQISEGRPGCDVINLLKRVGVPEPEKRFEEFPHTLSGGLRQRVLIAIALASNPTLLIADEPTTALDVTIQAQILDLLEELQKDKSTVLITHDLSVVARFCDRIVVMYAGKIVEDAPVEDLFRNPQHPYTQRLLQSIPNVSNPSSSLIPISGSPPDLTKPLPGCSFCPRCSYAMNICQTKTPPLFNNRAACWLHDPRRKS